MFARASMVTLAAAAALAVAWEAPAHAAAAAHHLSFYEVQTSFTQSRAGIEFTSADYTGNAAKHAAKSTASDHFACAFGKNKPPACLGQLAIGGSMLLIKGSGGMGDFTIPIVGGTGSFEHAHGKLTVHDLDAAADRSVLTISYTR